MSHQLASVGQLTLQSILVATLSADEVGHLVLADGHLVAVLVRLDDPVHEQACGGWSLEAGFGPFAGAQPEPFVDLDEALAWIEARVAPSTARASGSVANQDKGRVDLTACLSEVSKDPARDVGLR